MKNNEQISIKYVGYISGKLGIGSKKIVLKNHYKKENQEKLKLSKKPNLSTEKIYKDVKERVIENHLIDQKNINKKEKTKYEKNENLFEEFLKKKIIRTNEIKFEKGKNYNRNKIFSNFIIENNDPKSKSLLFRTLREKKKFAKNPIKCQIPTTKAKLKENSNVETLNLVSSKLGEFNHENFFYNSKKNFTSILKKNVDKEPNLELKRKESIENISKNVSKTDNNLKENKHYKELENQVLIKRNTFQSNIKKILPVKNFTINESIKIPESKLNTSKPKFDFHEYKFPENYNQHIQLSHDDNQINFNESNKDKFREQRSNIKKKNYFNHTKKIKKFINEEIRENKLKEIKAKVFSKQNKTESSQKHIPKRIFSGFNITNYSGKNIINQIKINEKLTENLNYELKNINIKESNSQEKNRIRPTSHRYFQENLLDYGKLNNENFIIKNDENLQVYQLTGDNLYLVEENYGKIINHNYASYFNQRDVFVQKKKKTHIEEEKLKVSFAVQKDDFSSFNELDSPENYNYSNHINLFRSKNNNTKYKNYTEEYFNHKKVKLKRNIQEESIIKIKHTQEKNAGPIEETGNLGFDILENKEFRKISSLNKFNLGEYKEFKSDDINEILKEKKNFNTQEIEDLKRNITYLNENDFSNNFNYNLFKNKQEFIQSNPETTDKIRINDNNEYSNLSINDISEMRKNINIPMNKDEPINHMISGKIVNFIPKNSSYLDMKEKFEIKSDSCSLDTSSDSSNSVITYIIPRKNKTFGDLKIKQTKEMILSPNNKDKKFIKLRPITAIQRVNLRIRIFKNNRKSKKKKEPVSRSSNNSDQYFYTKQLSDNRDSNKNIILKCENPKMSKENKNFYNPQNLNEIYLSPKFAENNQNLIENKDINFKLSRTQSIGKDKNELNEIDPVKIINYIEKERLDKMMKENLELVKGKKTELNQIRLKLTEEINENKKKIMKIHPLPQLMHNINNKLKKLIYNKNLTNTSDLKLFEKKELKDFDRYRKKKINIDDILIIHNSTMRKEINPLKTTKIHMKMSLNVVNCKSQIRPMTSNYNCFSKNETFTIKREYLNSFEKHAVDPYIY